MVHIYAPVFDDAYGAHVCMWCMYVYMVHLCTHVFGGACGECIWYMYVYIVHLCTHVCLVVHVCVYGAYVPVIGDACGVHAFHVLFTFQVHFMCFS